MKNIYVGKGGVQYLTLTLQHFTSPNCSEEGGEREDQPYRGLAYLFERSIICVVCIDWRFRNRRSGWVDGTMTIRIDFLKPMWSRAASSIQNFLLFSLHIP